MPDPWDKMAGLFSGDDARDGIPRGAADNILLAWPPILRLIEETFPEPEGLRALDFGCGTGEFCARLHAMGFRVTGADTSEEMLEIARRRRPHGIEFSSGRAEDMAAGAFDLVAAIMVLQFLEDAESALAQLDRLLRPGGLIALAVFNPQFVKNLLNAGVVFRDFDSDKAPRRGLMAIMEDAPIPVFVRTADEYARALIPLGYREVLRERPPFTGSFLRQHPVSFPASAPEFLLMGFLGPATDNRVPPLDTQPATH